MVCVRILSYRSELEINTQGRSRKFSCLVQLHLRVYQTVQLINISINVKIMKTIKNFSLLVRAWLFSFPLWEWTTALNGVHTSAKALRISRLQKTGGKNITFSLRPRAKLNEIINPICCWTIEGNANWFPPFVIAYRTVIGWLLYLRYTE